jgi:hypothetical protein
MEKSNKFYQVADGSGAYQNTNYPQYDTSVYDNYDTSFRRFNGLEFIVIVLSVIALISVFLWGLFAANTVHRDEQRIFHINQILSSLDNYYKNSNTVPSNRSYPTSVCSSSANSVDFELTLREHLTGKRKDKDLHAYINQNDYPSDPWGKYSTKVGERKIQAPCDQLLQISSKTAQDPIYTGGYSSCNFSSQAKNTDYYQCYLYGSSNNGDKFTLAYYNEGAGQLVFYSKFREDPITKVVCAPSRC